MNADLERLIALQQLHSAADAARRRLAEEPEHDTARAARLEIAEPQAARDVRTGLGAQVGDRCAAVAACQPGCGSLFMARGCATAIGRVISAPRAAVACRMTDSSSICGAATRA